MEFGQWVGIAVGFAGLVGSAVTFATFWTSQGRIAEKAESARASVGDAHKRIDESEKSIGNLRVEVARDYVSKGEMSHLENRIVGAITDLGKRLDQFLQRT